VQIPIHRFPSRTVSILVLVNLLSCGEAKVQTTAQEQLTRDTINLFNEAFNQHNAEIVESLLTDDTVFEDTSPAPDGRRVEGRKAVAEFWRAWFQKNPDAKFEAGEMIVSGNRATVLWIYRKMRNGQPWHLRGVDIFTVKDGKIASKLAYVKG